MNNPKPLQSKSAQEHESHDESRLRTALNAAQMGMWDWDLVTGEINWSPGHEQLFGLPPDSFDGSYATFDACLHPSDRESLNQAVGQALNNHTPYQHEFRVIWQDGSIHWIEGRGQAFYDETGEAVRMSGTVMAIDDRKRLERALQQSEQQFRAIFEAEPECIKVMTVDGILRNINPAGLTLVEANGLESVLGRQVCSVVSPAYQQAFLDFTQQAAQGKNAVLEFEMIGFKGTRRWLESRAVLLQPTDQETPYQETPYQETTDQAEDLILVITRDITERKQAEANLQEQEAILRLFIQSAPASIAMFDREMRYMMASQRWIDEYRLGSLESVIGRSHYDILPEIPERWRQIHQRCLAGAIEKCDDDLLIRADGTPQWISWEVRPWHTAGGEIGGIMVFSVDFTDRQQTAETLRQSEVRLRLAQLASNCGVWDWDLQTNGLFWSPEFYQLYGLAPTVESKYENWLSCIHPDDRAQINQATQRALMGTNTELNVQFRVMRSEEVRWFAGIGQVFRDADGKATRMAGITIDITRQKQTEIALQQLNTELEQRVAERTKELIAVNDRLSQSEEKFRQLAENIQDVFWIADAADQQILYISPAYETLWGKSRKLLYGNFCEWLDGIHPDDRSRVEKTIREKTAQGYYDHEYRIIHADGSIRWIRDRAFPIKDEAGKIIRIAGIAEDITERQRVEEIKNEFIGIVSHELRTPLTAIQMSLGLLKSGVYSNKPEKAQRMVEIAFLDTNRLVNLVNDILDLERLESGRAVLEKTICRADELMQQAINSVQSIAAQHHITLTLTPTDAVVWATPDTIVQTLTNLLSNAIKFSPAGGRVWVRAGEQGSGGAGEQGSKGAGERGSRGAREQGSRGAGEQGNRKLGEQISNSSLTPSSPHPLIPSPSHLLTSSPPHPPISSSPHPLTPSPPHPYILFSVTDEGRGIPRDKLETVFGRFQQVDASDSREKGGTGLGLPICRSIVERHGGKIWVESTLGAGSTFFFTLPVPPELA